MNCDEVRSRIHELVDGELDRTAAAGARAHLEKCRSCQGLHADVASLKALIRKKLRRPEARPGLAATLLGRLRLEARPGRSRAPLRAAAAACAALVALLAASLILRRGGEPLFGHAEASSACVEAYRRVCRAGACAREGHGLCMEKLLDEIHRSTGIELDRLPEVPGAVLSGWETETVRGVKGIRVDFRDAEGPAAPQVAPPPPAPGPMISVFFLPLRNTRFDEEYLEELEKGHPCTRCIDLEDGSIICFRRADLLVSVVSRLGEEEILERHRPRW